jgi:hypothetical protein
MLKRSDVAGVGIGLLLAVGTAHAATPEQRCQSAKNKAAGKYVSCRQSAEAKLATTPGDPIDLDKYSKALTRCATAYNRGWQKAIDKATQAGAVCPDAPLTAADFQAVIDDHTDNIATGLTDGSLTHCGNGILDFAETCDQNNLNGQSCASLGFAFGSLACGGGCVLDTSGCYSPPRLTDNGDGTITDHETRLVWEKKADLDGVPVACTSAAVRPDPHDADNLYTWTDSETPTEFPTGTTFTVFFAQLNAGSGFAGHTDWRLPTLAELHALVDYADATSPLVDVVFDDACTSSCSITSCSCTASDRHWTDSTLVSAPTDAWVVDHGNGEIVWDTKDSDYAVRAVRSGP